MLEQVLPQLVGWRLLAVRCKAPSLGLALQKQGVSKLSSWCQGLLKRMPVDLKQSLLDKVQQAGKGLAKGCRGTGEKQGEGGQGKGVNRHGHIPVYAISSCCLVPLPGSLPGGAKRSGAEPKDATALCAGRLMQKSPSCGSALPSSPMCVCSPLRGAWALAVDQLSACGLEPCLVQQPCTSLVDRAGDLLRPPRFPGSKCYRVCEHTALVVTPLRSRPPPQVSGTE